MGIKNLTQLIKSNAPNSIKTKALYELRGKTIAIDSSIIIYKSLTNYRNKGDYIRNTENKIISHLLGILNKTTLYLSLGIIPIFIFDGKPPESKKQTITERRNRIIESNELLKTAESIEEKIKLEKKTIRITPQYIQEIKELLDKLNVQYYHPDGEAETFASELCRKGIVDYVVTEDMDALACGSPYMIRNCIDKSIKRNDVVSIFSLEELLSDFKISFSQFIDLCILCGCDYCPTIPSIGPKTAFKLIQKYQTIENILLNEQNLKPCTPFKENYVKARETFYIFKDKAFCQEYISKDLNHSELQSYLKDNLNLSDKRVQNYIKKINNNNNV